MADDKLKGNHKTINPIRPSGTFPVWEGKY